MRSLPHRMVVSVLVGALLVLGLGAGPASAATLGHVALPDAGILGTLLSPITGVFTSIGGAVLGAFTWTVSLASKFILVTLGALVRMLIPRSWAKDAVQVFEWIVAIPDYAGTVSGPGGGQVYGFGGVNDLRELFQWLGIGLLPLTLVYATSRAMLGRGDHVAAPVARVVLLAGLLVSYPYWWEQAAALTNQLTAVILSPAAVISGIHQLMSYATEGVALGGWQLIDLGLMAALALELLALIFAKVVIILLGALLFATGPLMIGLVPTESGDVVARGWLSAVGALVMLPVAWAALFAVGAVMVDDASTAGPLIGGSTAVGSLLGGVMVAVAGVATLWLCLRAVREVGGLLRLQLGGLLVIAGRARSQLTPSPAAASGAGSGRLAGAAASIRGVQGRVAAAGSAALDAAGPHTATTTRSLTTLGRRGLVIGGARVAGSAGLAAGRLAVHSRAGSAARPHVAAAAATAAISAGVPGSRAGRAGAVAARMARAGTAAWQQPDRLSAAHPRERADRPRGTAAAAGAAAASGSAPAVPRAGDGQTRPPSPGGASGARTAAGPPPAAGRVANSAPDSSPPRAAQPPVRSAQPPAPRSQTRPTRRLDRPAAGHNSPSPSPSPSPPSSASTTSRPRPRPGSDDPPAGRE